MRKHLLRGAALATTTGFFLVGCGGGDGGGEEPLTLRVSDVNPPDSTRVQVVEEVAERVEERTDGELVLEVYPSGQIGSTGDTAEQAASGENVIAFMDASIIAQLGADDFGILGGPFLFDGHEEVNTFLESGQFDGMAQDVADEVGIHLLSMGWLDGPRHIWANEPVPEPEDLEGMKFRTPPVDVWTETFDLLGAVPTEVDNTETYSALEQGVVDGAEGPVNGTYEQRWHEVAPHATLTGHFQLLLGFGMSEQVWQQLTSEQQEILTEEFIDGGLETQEKYLAEIEDTKQVMQDEDGVEFHEADVEAYREKTEPFYDQYGDLYGKVRDAIEG